MLRAPPCLRRPPCFRSQLKTTTTAAISKEFTEDRIWLNGQEEDIGQPRLQACLGESEWPRGARHAGPCPSFPSVPSSLCRVSAHTHTLGNGAGAGFRLRRSLSLTPGR